MPDISGGLGTGSAGTPLPDRAVPLSGWFSRNKYAGISGAYGTALPGTVTYYASEGYDWFTVDNADRLIINSWANAGVWDGGVKGIPDTSGWTVLNVKDYGAVGNGIADDTVAIQAAVDVPGQNHIIYFPEGTYRFTTLLLYMRDRILLAGDGPSLSVLNCFGSGAWPAIRVQGGDDLAGPYPVISGAAKGSTTITLSNVTGLAEGDVITVYPALPSGFPGTPGVGRLPFESTQPPVGLAYDGWSYNGATYPRTGVSSNCAWYDGFSQLVEITGIDGFNVTFKEPLYYNYAPYSPMAKRYGPVIKTVGIEDLTVQFDPTASAGSHLIWMKLAKDCWVRNCNVYRTRSHSIYLGYCKSCEIAGNYVHHAFSYGGGAAYLISVADHNSDHLIYDNVCYHGRHHIVFEGGGQGCVVAYNYSQDTMGDTARWMFSDLGLHGRHPYMNLWEGNYAGGLEFDSIHGSSSHNVVLRNAFSSRGQDDYGTYTSASIGMKVAKDSVYHTFVGNVLGYAGCAADGCLYEQYNYVRYSRYMIYFGASGDTAGPYSANPEFEFPWSMPAATRLMHGNYDYADGGTKWDPGIAGHEIPASLYLAAKPSWFGALDWPAVGPDVAGYKKDIPAKTRWDRYIISGQLSDLFTSPGFVIDHAVIDTNIETSLSAIPEAWVEQAKANLVIAYGTASHGTQLIYGMNCMMVWDGSGLYNWANGGAGGALDIRWWGAPTGFGNLGISFSIDLLAPDGTYDPTRAVWVSSTRTYLNAHPEVNVCMWAWCYGMATSESDINLYLSQMETLEAEYPGVRFVYMTGHSDGSGLTGLTHLRAQQIKAYCIAHNKVLYDFYDIECYDPSGAYFGDKNVSADCSYTGGNWATEWQAAHPGEWFACANCVDVHAPALNCNVKSVAAWHLWARLAGWNGE